MPAIILNSFEFDKRNFPIKVAAAPKKIKTMENPTVNKMIGIKLTFLDAVNSCIELPVT